MATKKQSKSPQEIYLDKHRKCGIKVGDKVKVMRKCESGEQGWDNNWIRGMDSSVGMIGKIKTDMEVWGFKLSFTDEPENSNLCYPYFVLQKVEGEEEKPIVRICKTKPEARALANFLWNEKQRHLTDIRIIDEDLSALVKKWGVQPTKVKVFVRP